MNEQLQNALSLFIEKAINGLDSSVAFMQSELPDVIEQLLMWYGVKYALYMLLAIVLIIVWCKSEMKINKALRDSEGNIKDGSFYVPVYLLIGIVPRFIIIGCVVNTFNLTWLQIWIAPKIWLIEYAATLTSK